MKLFNSNNMDIITYCQQQYMSFDLPSVLWAKRVSTFNLKFDNIDNLFCRLCYGCNMIFTTVFVNILIILSQYCIGNKVFLIYCHIIIIF